MKTITITEETLKHLDDETQELFRDFVDRVVWGELFAGCDPEDYILHKMKLNLTLKVEEEK